MVIIDEMERRIKLKTLNSHITCKICRGYLIDATTVTECLHTFCKSCLVKHLEEKHTCPTCQIVIHQSHPLQYISFDRTMQDIVYKLVPDLQESKSFISVSIFSAFFIQTEFHFSAIWRKIFFYFRRDQARKRVLQSQRFALSQGYFTQCWRNRGREGQRGRTCGIGLSSYWWTGTCNKLSSI